VGGGVRGVWFLVKDPESLKKVASTDALDQDDSRYRFFPSRVGERLAYVGNYGLEYIDYGERSIYRFAVEEPRVPLAWNEAREEIYYLGREGIYRVSLKGGKP
jgi:hypothetical protein